MPRTVPTVDDTPNYKRVSLRLIDVSGDKRAVSIEMSLAATAVEIEAMIVSYAALTRANIYAVEVHDVYFSPARATDALSGGKSDSVADGVNFLFVSNTNASEAVRLVAPVDTLVEIESDTVVQAVAEPFGLLVEPLLTGTKVLVSAQYSERKEKSNNPKTAF